MKKILLVLAACLVLLPDTADGKSGIWSRWKNLFTASDQDSVENTALSYLPLLLQDAPRAVLDTIRPVRIHETLHPDREDLRSSGPSFPRPAPYVGSIPIEASVSPTGARIYTVPIVTTGGLKLTPEIALQYNSQGGYGTCGYGWDIAGLSKITRILEVNLSQY